MLMDPKLEQLVEQMTAEVNAAWNRIHARTPTDKLEKRLMNNVWRALWKAEIKKREAAE